MSSPNNFEHRLIIQFESDDLINIRIRINNDVRVIQCRSTILFVDKLEIADKNIITIENLSESVCRIKQVKLNFLDITEALYQFTETTSRDDGSKIGDFVSEIYQPDICTMSFDFQQLNVYRKLLEKFKNGSIKY